MPLSLLAPGGFLQLFQSFGPEFPIPWNTLLGLGSLILGKKHLDLVCPFPGVMGPEAPVGTVIPRVQGIWDDCCEIPVTHIYQVSCGFHSHHFPSLTGSSCQLPNSLELCVMPPSPSLHPEILLNLPKSAWFDCGLGIFLFGYKSSDFGTSTLCVQEAQEFKSQGGGEWGRVGRLHSLIIPGFSYCY